MNKITTIDRDLKLRCQKDQVFAIRELLDTQLENAIINLRVTKADHRYCQGYLQALDDFHGLITKP